MSPRALNPVRRPVDPGAVTETLRETPAPDRARASPGLRSYVEDVDRITGRLRELGAPGLASAKTAATLQLEGVGGSAIVTFFGHIVQVMLSDLEDVLGAKARELFQGVLKDSKYYSSFLSQFSPQSNGSANAIRIREYMKTRELKLSKQELLQAFTEVIQILLREESKLLGTKGAQQTIARLMEEMTRTGTMHQPLKDYLADLLRRQPGGWS